MTMDKLRDDMAAIMWQWLAATMGYEVGPFPVEEAVDEILEHLGIPPKEGWVVVPVGVAQHARHSLTLRAQEFRFDARGAKTPEARANFEGAAEHCERDARQLFNIIYGMAPEDVRSEFSTPDCPHCGCVQNGQCLCDPSQPALGP